MTEVVSATLNLVWLLQRDTMVDLHNAGSIGIKGPKVP